MGSATKPWKVASRRAGSCFLVRKDHASGEIRFSIEARWRAGELPYLRCRIGFRLFVPRLQWHQQAHRPLALLSRFRARSSKSGSIAHEGPLIPSILIEKGTEVRDFAHLSKILRKQGEGVLLPEILSPIYFLALIFTFFSTMSTTGRIGTSFRP